MKTNLRSKLLTLAFTVAMCLTLLVGAAGAEEEPGSSAGNPINISDVGYLDLTENTPATETYYTDGDLGTAVWTPGAPNVLTLNGITITSTVEGKSALTVPDNTTVEVSGTCILQGGIGDAGLHSTGALTVNLSDDATLTATAGKDSAGAWQGSGIFAAGAVNVTGTGTLQCLGLYGIDAESVTIEETVRGYAVGTTDETDNVPEAVPGIGIYSATSVSKPDHFRAPEGPVTVENNLDGTECLFLYNAENTLYRYADNGTALWEPTVDGSLVTGGTLTLTDVNISTRNVGENAVEAPDITIVEVQGDCTLQGGPGGRAGDPGDGLACYNNLTVKLAENATLTAIGGDQIDYYTFSAGHGIDANNVTVETANGSRLTATGGKMQGRYTGYGIRGVYSVTLNGTGRVQCQGNYGISSIGTVTIAQTVQGYAVGVNGGIDGNPVNQSTTFAAPEKGINADVEEVKMALETTEYLSLSNVKKNTLYLYKDKGMALWVPTVADETITRGALTLNNVAIEPNDRGLAAALIVPRDTTVTVQGACVLSRGGALGGNGLSVRGNLKVELAENATLEATGGDGGGGSQTGTGILATGNVTVHGAAGSLLAATGGKVNGKWGGARNSSLCR